MIRHAALLSSGCKTRPDDGIDDHGVTREIRADHV